MRAHSGAERTWIDNTLRLIGTLSSDIDLSTAGGANVASARRALKDDSSLYTILVAYSAFGDCNTELANTGIPSARAAAAVRLLRDACRVLVHASDLFERATQHNDPAALVAAGNAVLLVVPLLEEARVHLQELRVS